MKNGRAIDIIRLIISIAISHLAGAIGSVATFGSLDTWYRALDKPSFTPPGWIFGPVWGVLYTLMGIAAWLIWRKGSENLAVRFALGLFVFQLVLNTLWSLIFFGARSPFAALIEIFFLYAAIWFTTFVFFKISKPAGFLMLPYIAWVSFAIVLNAAIVRLNP